MTSLQAFLGHKRLSTTMVYARVHNRTVADDYFAAMDRIEKHLDLLAYPKQESSGDYRFDHLQFDQSMLI